MKAEIGPADIVACRGDEDPVIVELKTGFTLALIHQAIDRLSMTDYVYVAVPRGSGRGFFKTLNMHKRLCRRLGLGLMTVRIKDGFTDIHCDPEPYNRANQNPKKRVFFTGIFSPCWRPEPRRYDTKNDYDTAYRQDALRCLNHLKHNGPTKAAMVAISTNVTKARDLMARDHYGWF